jgi:hypothetical protein
MAEPPKAPPARHVDAGAGAAGDFGDLPRTTIDMDGTPVEITKADADSLARELVQQVRLSTLEANEKEVLLARTIPYGTIDSEGTVRIAPWVLMRFGGEWGLLFRFLPPDPAQYTAFFASVARGSAGLGVGDITRILFHPPRRPPP